MNRPFLIRTLTLCLIGVGVMFRVQASEASGTLPRVLFLGDDGPHRPAERFKQLEPVLSEQGIEIIYTDQLSDINPSNLAGFDSLMVYANITQITPEAEKSMLDFVSNGGGLVPVHCASFCFHNSPKYIELVGAQFQRHGAGVFKETIVDRDHPIMNGLDEIESWDESYVHSKHNPEKTVLAVREDNEGKEPWTWVRSHGKGRVFYTAWGHDQRTWSHPGFHALITQGIRWASAHSPGLLHPKEGLPEFQYEPSTSPLPNYTPGARWGTQGEPITTMQLPLPPDASMKHLVTLPEFTVELVASEPEIIKPLWLAWDHRGRLWIAESVDYPNQLQSPGEGRDRLKICEDTDGDGKADTFIVFADKLSIPTGFVFAGGGVIVIHSGRTEIFYDRDGDDKADESRVLFEGWSMRDTHATASNLRYGFDNWIWGTVGYSGFNGTVGGKEIRFGQGIFRFKPDGSELEFIRSSNNNTWGLGITEDNIIIGSTANGNASMYMPIPNRYYEAVRGWSASRLESIADSQRMYPITDKVRQVDWHGRYTAGSGSAIYTARDFPSNFWNKAQFVAEPTGHLLGLFFLERKGADFTAHNARNFVASDDEWTSPVYAEVGPDGALYVVDWYNYIIQHNPTPIGFETGKGAAYETPLRDKTHGRIYRVKHKDSEHDGRAGLNPDRPRQLVAALQSDNLLWRMHAQRLLVERGQTEVAPALLQLIDNTELDAIGLNPSAVHALWTLKGMGVLDGPNRRVNRAVMGALGHPSAAVRRAAVQVMPRSSGALNALLDAGVLQDADSQVRLAALLALSEMPVSEKAGQVVHDIIGNDIDSDDVWMVDAATAAAARHDIHFLKAAMSASHPGGSEPVQTQSGKELIRNGNFDARRNNQPAAWQRTVHSGEGDFQIETEGRKDQSALSISSNSGGDLSWATRVTVNPRTDYLLTGWIKTENIQKRGRAQGALLNIHELQDPVAGATEPLTGDNDWTPVQFTFNSGALSEITINCLYGGWGRVTGKAWFDDISLRPAPGSALKGAQGTVVRLVASHYARRAPVDSIVDTLDMLKGADAVLISVILDSLVKGWPEGQNPQISEADKERLSGIMEALPESERDRLILLTQNWGQTGLFDQQYRTAMDTLANQVKDSTLDDAARATAARRWIGLKDDPEVIESILDQVNLISAPGLAEGLIGSLTTSSHSDTGRLLVEHWQEMTPAAKKVALPVLMRRGEWTMALLNAVESGAVLPTDVAPEQWSQLKQHPSRFVARRAATLSETVRGISEDRKEIVEKLLPLAKQRGDSQRGMEIYETSCAVCHVFKGKGGHVGPDLTGIEARDRADILLEILDPNRSVEANYRMWNIATKDGEIYSGRLEAETQTTVEILDTAAQKHVIQRKDIQSIEASPLSIMPTGFEALPEADLRALLEYMAPTQSSSNE